MMKTSHFRGHPIVYKNKKWVYVDNGLPANENIRPCVKCGKQTTLGEGEVDPCLGVLPGVDNACCGHGIKEMSYIRFTSGVVIKNFDIEYTERFNKKEK